MIVVKELREFPFGVVEDCLIDVAEQGDEDVEHNDHEQTGC